MSLIDSSYFVRDIFLPAGQYNTITLTIARYEKDILELLLGYELANLCINYTVASDQRIIDLVEGKEYTEGEYTVKWRGLKNTDKSSLIAYYVYIQYLKDQSMAFMNVGQVASNVENGTNMGIARLIQKASARLREMAGYPGCDLYAGSLYAFLTKFYDDYPEWIWNEYKFENMFGL